ncbi:hypothetical protein YQE_04828, partial [Dendroctonus ponderosae]
MDLLDSIMSSMDKPPSLSEKERTLIKMQKDVIEKKQNEEKERLKRFKERVEAKLTSHFKNPKNIMLKFDPMDQIQRSIVHEAAETHNLLSYAFGTDGVDRYIRVYSRDNPPCEDELAARRRGEPWNEEVRQQLLKNRERERLEAMEPIKKPKKLVPNTNYKDKYAHLIGQDAALKAAKKTESNKSYGFGTTEEKAPLTLEKCLSYDEIKLSAFLYVSSYTHFVNKGDRKNKAVYLQNRALVEKTGIIAGMIGPRLKKQGVMDFQEMVITEKQNKKSNGYGNVGSIHTLFANFFEGESLLYSEAVQRRKSGAETDRFVDIKTPKGAIFDNHIYRKRLTIVFDCLLIEANQRALEAGKMAYIHLVGLGLGVWKTSDHQEKVFMDCFSNRIKTLSKQLSSVSDICFSYFKEASCGDLVHGNTIPIENHPKKGIKIHIFNRQPHEALNDEGKLLVVSYAWDGNAYPGNEYWNGQLGSSGDSAAASSTQVTELHNPQINPLVCADNLRIVSVKGKLLRLERYLEKKRNLKRKREELLEDD